MLSAGLTRACPRDVTHQSVWTQNHGQCNKFTKTQHQFPLHGGSITGCVGCLPQARGQWPQLTDWTVAASDCRLWSSWGSPSQTSWLGASSSGLETSSNCKQRCRGYCNNCIHSDTDTQQIYRKHLCVWTFQSNCWWQNRGVSARNWNWNCSLEQGNRELLTMWIAGQYIY